MNYYILDAETYWADDYTLSKSTPEEYIRSPRFKDHGWGIAQIDSGVPSLWLPPGEFKQWLKSVDLTQHAVICHNTRFDGAILGWRYGVRPRLWIDTMGMFRALYPGLNSYALASLGTHFDVGEKGSYLLSTKNKLDLTPFEFEQLGIYCKQDCHITAHLFNIAWPQFPYMERLIMDTVLRMFIEPVLHVDVDLLRTHLTQLVIQKRGLLEACGLGKKDLMSSDKFARALEVLGVDPPMKASPSNAAKQIYAFAKTDKAMAELAEHDDPRVQTLVAARLGHKSTLMETRIERLIGVGERGTLPVPQNYWGAKTTGRTSGADLLNLTNLTRGSVLRDSLIAPPGMMIVVGDSSNIELRFVMAAAGQDDQTKKLREGVDLYCDFGTHDIYHRTITKANITERFVSKTGMLSLQYMASGQRFHEMLRQAAAKENALHRGEPGWVDIVPPSREEAERVKDAYRTKHRKVKNLWYYCEEEVLPAIMRGDTMKAVDVNGWFLTDGKGFALPGEIGVQYPGLKYVAGDGWSYDTGRGRAGLYGAKVVEHMCQHGSRHVVMYQTMLFRTRYPVVHSVYDEIVSCVPEDQADECSAFMLSCLQTAPPWCKGALPVTGEVGVGRSYGSAK